MAAADLAGKVWDEQAIVVSEMVKARGNTIIALTDGRSGALAARRRSR